MYIAIRLCRKELEAISSALAELLAETIALVSRTHHVDDIQRLADIAHLSGRIREASEQLVKRNGKDN